MLVLLAAAFDPGEARLPATVHWLLAQQLEDGGWNCETIRSGSVHGSFHTSITVLEALDAPSTTSAPRVPGGDPRLGDALELVRRARRPDGRWPHRSPYPGRTWFPLESAGPSRWHTLRALRVLKRYGASMRETTDAEQETIRFSGGGARERMQPCRTTC